MPLGATLPDLQAKILQALNKAATTPTNPIDAATARKALADELGLAFYQWMLTAVIQTQGVNAPGQLVLVVPFTGAGATTGPGIVSTVGLIV